jgi:hypothetical protein
MVFDDHQWRLSEGNEKVNYSQLDLLRNENKTLQEENQLLKFKLDLLLDMVSTTKLDLLNTELELQQYRDKKK